MVSIQGKIVLIGGEIPGPDGGNLKDIYKLDCHTCQWERLELKLQYARQYFVAFPLPVNWTTC